MWLEIERKNLVIVCGFAYISHCIAYGPKFSTKATKETFIEQLVQFITFFIEKKSKTYLQIDL